MNVTLETKGAELLPPVPNRFGGDGYDFIGALDRSLWRPHSTWGQDGWDAGDWPYVVLASVEALAEYGALYYVEGDVTVASFGKAAERDAWIDVRVFWHWKARNEPWVAEVESVDDLDPKYRGPFSWERCRAENNWDG